MVNTRSKRQATNSGSTNSGQVKRPRGRKNQERAASGTQEHSSRDGTTERPPPASTSQSRPGHGETNRPPAQKQSNLELPDLTLFNYESALDYWPIPRINRVLASQTSDNEKLTAVVIAHSQAVLERFEHTLHMIAMIAGCTVAVLKRRLGLSGGSHGENPWNRWLSFSIEAQKLPMPVRGDPDAGEVLTRRNKANGAAYENLSDDEFAIYTAPIFYALGGYPNYSAINVTDLANINVDDVLVPEVPQLSEVQEARYRPIYLNSVDLNKVKKDKELSTPAVSSSAIEKRSLQCYRKIATQLARDSPLVGLDYLLIACSKSPLGEGWCEVKTSQDELVVWLDREVKFKQLFPIFAQGRTTFAQILEGSTENKKSGSTRSRNGNQQCDQVKNALTAKINANLIKVLGSLPLQKWPRGPNPIQALQDRKIDVYVRRDPKCSLSKELWELGYKGMETAGRKAWLKDYEDNLFELLPLTDPSRRTGPDHPGIPGGGVAISGGGVGEGETSGGVIEGSDIGGGGDGGVETGGGVIGASETGGGVIEGETGGGEIDGGLTGGGGNSAGLQSGSGAADPGSEAFFSQAQIGAWA